jgi:hypothetical protein
MNITTDGTCGGMKTAYKILHGWPQGKRLFGRWRLYMQLHNIKIDNRELGY